MASSSLSPLSVGYRIARRHIHETRRHKSLLVNASRDFTNTRHTPLKQPSHSVRPILPKQNSHFRSFHTSRPALSVSKFTYGIAASFTAKDKKYNPSTHIVTFDPSNNIRSSSRRRHKKARPASGQDAFFISKIGSTSDVALGVADGVGGWVDSGVDPADFSHGICEYMAHAAGSYTPEESSDKSFGARNLMQRGYEDISQDKSVPAGGSTACVAIAKADGKMEVANLGDSGFIHLRLNAIHNYSEPQTHAFNTPYQLSIIPERLQRQSRFFGGQRLCDFPKDANVTQHQLRHGDVLIFASDGVWDNLSGQDILKIVSSTMINARAWEHSEKGVGVSKSLQRLILATDDVAAAAAADGGTMPALQAYLAQGITGEAKAASKNTKLDGPFAREVKKYYPGEEWRGGKVDDICVVVMVVCEEGR